MPYRQDAPHVVIPCRDGENRELRYALRSLERFFDYGKIWVVGSWPRWLREDTEHLHAVKRPKMHSKYRTTRGHYRWACRNPQISDPWVMWNDDFFCLTPTHDLAPIHRGTMADVRPLYDTWRSKWAVGMRETHDLMRKLMPHQKLYCYDLHTPLLVHSATMLRALDLAEKLPGDAPHVRTLYGNLAKLGGTPMRDPKIYTPRTTGLPPAWLSSEENTFRRAVEPQLRAAGLTRPSVFEIPGIPDERPGQRTATMRDPLTYRRQRYRVMKTPEGNRVMRAPTPQPPVNHALTAVGREQRAANLERNVAQARKGKAGCLSCGR